MADHTPGPWTFVLRDDGTAILVEDSTDQGLGEIFEPSVGSAEQNAQAICRAVNNHDALLAALERVGNVADTARMLVINSDPEEADRYHHDWAICQKAISDATGRPIPTTAIRVLKEAADRAAIAAAEAKA